MSDLVFVYVTAPSETVADGIAEALVGERLAACANILPGMRSVYRWKGEIARDREVVLIAKTRAERLPAITRRIKELHPYEVPCIVALPLLHGAGNPDFLAWIAAETGFGDVGGN